MKSFFVAALISLAVASPTLTTRDESSADTVMEARAPQESDAIQCFPHGTSYSACNADPECLSCNTDLNDGVAYCCIQMG